jgi:branched-chain amino acid transport system substrate-binding protein
MMKQSVSVAIFISMIVLSGCSKKESQTETGTNAVQVVIAHAAPLTGAQAHLGKDNENGVRLAIDELNSKEFKVGDKSVVFSLDSQDDQADPRLATTIARQFIDEKVTAVIGHLNSGTTIPTSRLYNEAKIVQVSPSATNPQYTQQGFTGAFRVMANDVQQGKVLGDFAVQELKAKRIAIIDDRTAYGSGLAAEFEKAVLAAGASIVKKESTSDKATDFAAALTSVKASNPDLLFFGGMDAQGAPMIRQMRTLGLQALFLGGDGIHTAEFMKIAKADAEGVYASLPGVPLEAMPKGPAFKAQFEKKYGVIQLYAPYCYDAMMVLAQAMQKAGSIDPQKYLPELKKTHYSGVTATIEFDEKGDLKNGAISVYKVEKGDWTLVKTIGGAL